MTPATPQQMIAHVSQLLAERLGARGPTLAARLDSRARALPRRVRLAVRLLAEAEMAAASPKMARHLDLKSLQAAHDTSAQYLAHLNAGRRLWRRVVDVTTSVTFGLIVMGVALGVFLRLRDLL